MKQYQILAAAAVFMLLAACDKTQQAVDDAPRLIELGAEGDNINACVTTKATEVTSLSGFNLTVTKGSTGSEQAVWNNAPFTATGTMTPITYTGNKFWPAQNQSYHFYASNVTMDDATANGVTVSATNDNDIVCAFKMTPTFKDRNTLVFEHIFARLGDVVITPATGYTISNVSVSITPNTGGTYAVKTGAGRTDDGGWSNLTAASPVQISGSTCPSTKANDIYLVPGTYTLTASWQANINEYERVYTNKTVNVQLLRGKVNVINATLGGDAEEIKFSVSVNAWTDNTINTTFPVF
ncbi:MAG: fimbrillin family protein [Bacteroidales bacterium]|nr:fimbrillin family protein [Bacteroidales bacterium]